MKLLTPSRRCLSAAIAVLLLSAPAYARNPGQKAPQQPSQPHSAAPQHFESRPQSGPHTNEANRPAGMPSSPPRQQHLEQWMNNHKDLSLAEQQRALQNEPGFRELPPQVQQNQLNTLGRLYTMDPQQRNRMLNRVERLERLSPQQQQQWDHAVQQLNAVPTPRRRLMTRAIIDLREMPAEQRQQVIESPAFGDQFSPDERQTIRTVLTAY